MQSCTLIRFTAKTTIKVGQKQNLIMKIFTMYTRNESLWWSPVCRDGWIVIPSSPIVTWLFPTTCIIRPPGVYCSRQPKTSLMITMLSLPGRLWVDHVLRIVNIMCVGWPGLLAGCCCVSAPSQEVLLPVDNGRGRV